MAARLQRPSSSWSAWLFAGWLLGVSVPLLVGQILAFVGWFHVALVLLLSLGLLPLLAYAYIREGIPSKPISPSPKRFYLLAFYALGGVLWALILFPVLFWPRTHLGGFMGGVMAWDVVYYHLPKAVDVVQRRHMWNLAIPYGQYAPGWEILLALSIGIGRNAEGLGPAAGVALTGFLLGFSLLLARETRWPGAVAGALVGWMVYSFYIPIPNNPWRELGFVVHYGSGIGKNDLLAAALVLAMLWHTPLSIHPDTRQGHRWGIGLSLASAFAVKPNAGLAAGLLMVLSVLSTKWRPGKRAWVGWLAAGVLGNLWLVRNLILLGRPFSPIADVLSRRAVLYALPKAAFWHPLPKTWLLVTVAVFGLMVWTWRHPAWLPAVAAAALLYGLFLLTPAGIVIHGPHWRVEWRLGLALLVWTWVLLWAGFAWILRTWNLKRSLGFEIGLALLALGAAGGLWHRYGYRLTFEPEHARVLYDPFPEPVGVDGYWSVFDFIHREVRYASIDFDNAPPFYIYDPDLTNRLAKPGFYPAGMPWVVPQPKPDHWLFCVVPWGPKARAEDPAAVAQKVAAWRAAGLTVLYADPACALARK